MLAACTQPAQQVNGDFSSLSIATGTTAGVYYPVGGAIAEIINREVDEVGASAESTGASVENLRLIAEGQSQVAIVQGDAAYQAFHGQGPFEGNPLEARALITLYPNVYHGVTLESTNDRLGLDCFSDVAGHRFSVGAPGSGNELATNLIFDALDMSIDDISVQRYAYAETARALREGQLDAGAWVVGEGHGSLRELEATDPLHLIPICEDELAAVTDEHPFYTPHTITGDTYSTVTDDVNTMALWNVLVVSPDVPDDLAYELVQAIYDNVDSINRVYEPGAEYLVPETLAQSPVPLHHGTIRFAEEHGIELPDELRR
jgi:uncharacterized protein